MTGLQPITDNPEIAAPIASLLLAVALYYVVGLDVMVGNARLIAQIRTMLPRFVDDRTKEDLRLVHELDQHEHVATVHASWSEVWDALLEIGAHPNPAAAHKITEDGREEIRSLAIRDLPDEFEHMGRLRQTWHILSTRRQTHISLFKAEGGKTDVYAHNEYNSLHPLKGAEHYLGEGMDVARGVSEAIDALDEAGLHYGLGEGAKQVRLDEIGSPRR